MTINIDTAIRDIALRIINDDSVKGVDLDTILDNYLDFMPIDSATRSTILICIRMHIRAARPDITIR